MATKTKKYCQKCEETRPNEQEYCPICGTKLEKITVPKTSTDDGVEDFTDL